MKFSQAAEVLTNSTPVELISWEPEGERRRRHEERVSSRSFSPRLELQVMPEKEASWTWTWRLSPIREYQMWLCDGDTEVEEGQKLFGSSSPSPSPPLPQYKVKVHKRPLRGFDTRPHTGTKYIDNPV